MSEENFIFKAGDHVKYLPMGDEVYILEKAIGVSFPLKIICKHLAIPIMTDGKTSKYHRFPSIELVHRPEENKDSNDRLEERLKKIESDILELKKLCLLKGVSTLNKW